MIEALDVAALRRIGLGPVHLSRLPELPDALSSDPDMILARVVEVQRDHVLLHDGHAAQRARIANALFESLHEEHDALAVGDWVLAARAPGDTPCVQARLPRSSRLMRRDPSGRRQPLAANVDTALLVMGLDHDFNLQRLDRYLALAKLSQVQPVVVLTKADTCADTAERLALALARAAGAPVMAVNGMQPSARASLAPWLGEGSTLVLLGSSGAGKSTLANTLLQSVVQRAGAVRDDDSRGRHTTSARSLHFCAEGACIIDTPGLRTLQLDADEAELHEVFDDVARLALQCRFRDCGHAGEPGCAVREQIEPHRLRNFHKLLRESQRDSRGVLERQAEIARWKARGRAARMQMKAKRG